ncbi:MAG: DUF1565 domain-containing protein, partial [Candidatus Omnitrophica bacterium]|nr:DUF1565 domain-containing protein [Candidatus Omnitrophota bacterium]
MRRFLWTALASLLLLWVAGSPGHSATISVGDGFDYETISAAISNATDGDILLVAPGVYDTTRGESFPLRPTAAIAIRASSEDARPVIRTEHISRTFAFDNIDSATLEGLEITPGELTAFQIRSSTVTIRNSKTSNENAGQPQGLIDATDSVVELVGCQISHFLDMRNGSTISCTRSRLILKDCEFLTSTRTVGFGLLIRGDRCPEVILENSSFREMQP